MSDDAEELRDDVREILEPLDDPMATRQQLMDGVRLVLAMLDADEDEDEDEDVDEDEDEEEEEEIEL